MFFARNFVAWAPWTKPCGQNTSDSNNDCHYEQNNENLPQSESESTIQKVLNTMLLGSDHAGSLELKACQDWANDLLFELHRENEVIE